MHSTLRFANRACQKLSILECSLEATPSSSLMVRVDNEEASDRNISLALSGDKANKANRNKETPRITIMYAYALYSWEFEKYRK
ncbi:unnamed protein product [Acanthoscelides obtectus]|uniref:Uncharacterized protein n=1 Tax=Acanthoscelides obtectus TaxID=200917 RepID=A0A9P0KQW7_ACAOB|nr:unnamed protein product [Acanthoscelides obtectus]CAK1628287.1 hypothetical protein AOBTE_LOCUS5110 [Acanthoscelides obtectus]